MGRHRDDPGGTAGALASAARIIEKVAALADPTHVPSCSINPVISCGSVMMSWQAELLGFPNPVLGLAGFPVVAASGAAILARGYLRRWYRLAGSLAGVGLVHWLIFQSLYRINALCPYCMVVWSITIPLFVVVACITLRPLAGNPVARVLYQWRWPLVALWVTAVILAILVRFWYFWTTLI